MCHLVAILETYQLPCNDTQTQDMQHVIDTMLALIWVEPDHLQYGRSAGSRLMALIMAKACDNEDCHDAESVPAEACGVQRRKPLRRLD